MMDHIGQLCCVTGILAGVVGCLPARQYDVVTRGGIIVDGSGGEPFIGDVAIVGDEIAAIGSLHQALGRLDIDATGLAVLTLTEAGARTWFVNAEFDGVVYSSVAVTFV